MVNSPIDCGYEVEVITNDHPDMYCMVCLKLMREPVQFRCSHGICKPCYGNLQADADKRWDIIIHVLLGRWQIYREMPQVVGILKDQKFLILPKWKILIKKKSEHSNLTWSKIPSFTDLPRDSLFFDTSSGIPVRWWNVPVFQNFPQFLCFLHFDHIIRWQCNLKIEKTSIWKAQHNVWDIYKWLHYDIGAFFQLKLK